MALSPELKAAIDKELAEVRNLDVAAELASLNEPEAPQEAPQGAPQVTEGTPPGTPQTDNLALVEAPDTSVFQTPVDPNSFASAIGRGVETMQANIGGTIRTVGELTGSQFLEDYGNEMAEENLEAASQYGQPEVRSYKDVHDIPSIGSYLKNNISEALPSMGTVLAGGAAGARAGMAFGAPGRVGGAVIGSFLSSLGINVGALSNQMKELDPESSNPWTSLLGGAGLAALDTAGAGVIAAPLIKHIGKDGAYNLLLQSGLPKTTAIEAVTQGAKHALVSGVAESATSATQQALQDTLAYGAVGQQQDNTQFVDNVLNAALTGGAMGTLGGAVSRGADVVAVKGYEPGSARVSPETAPTASQMAPKSAPVQLFDAMGNSATALLTPLTRASQVAKDFVEEFRPDMTGRTASKRTIFEDQELQAGKWNTQLDDIIHGKSNDEIIKIINDASSGISTPEATQLRSVLNDVKSEAENRGQLNVGTIENYMPFGLSPEKVNTPEFLADIESYYDSPEAAAEAVANWNAEISAPDRGNTAPEVTQHVVQNPQTGAWEVDPRFRVGGDPETSRAQLSQRDIPPRFGQLEESRSFGNVPQSILNKYTLNATAPKLVQELRDYFEGASHRIAFSERFGVNGEKANAKIFAAVAEAQQNGKRVTKQEVDRMYDLVNAYNGMYGRIKNETLKKTAGVVSSAVIASRLPLAGLSTLAEFSIPFAKAGVLPALGAVMPTLGEVARQGIRKIISSVPQSETGRLLSDMNHTLAASTSIMADRIGSNVFNTTGQKIVRWEFLLNGLSVMSQLNRVFALKAGEKVYQNNLSDFAAGLPMSSAQGALKLSQLREMGVNITSPQDALKLIAPSSPSEVTIANNVKTLAMRRFIDQTVLDPTFADKPMWMSNGMIQMAGLLKGYPAAYGNIILPMLMRRMSPHFTGSWTNAAAGGMGIAFSLGLMLSLGYIQDELRQQAKGSGSTWQDTRTEGQQAMDVIMQQMPLQVSMLWDMISAERRGSTPVEVVAGPVAGLMTETGRAIGRTISSFEEDPSAGEVFNWFWKQSPARPFKGIGEYVEEQYNEF